MNKTIEQDHRRGKRRIRSMRSFKSTAIIPLADIQLVHMTRKQQGVVAAVKALSLKLQFMELIA